MALIPHDPLKKGDCTAAANPVRKPKDLINPHVDQERVVVNRLPGFGYPAFFDDERAGKTWLNGTLHLLRQYRALHYTRTFLCTLIIFCVHILYTISPHSDAALNINP